MPGSARAGQPSRPESRARRTHRSVVSTTVPLSSSCCVKSMVGWSRPAARARTRSPTRRHVVPHRQHTPIAVEEKGRASAAACGFSPAMLEPEERAAGVLCCPLSGGRAEPAAEEREGGRRRTHDVDAALADGRDGVDDLACRRCGCSLGVGHRLVGRAGGMGGGLAGGWWRSGRGMGVGRWRCEGPERGRATG